MKLFVYAEDDGVTSSVGVAFTQTRRGRLSSTFAYDNSYLANPSAYAIDPELPLADGNWPASAALPRAFLDAAPDRWGRNLIDRRAATQAREQRAAAPALNDVDYLLGVSDSARQGALRFKLASDGPFENPRDDVPPLVSLPLLQAAAATVVADGAGADEAAKTLLDLGSASIGGARPKATVRDGQRLFVAKFAHSQDKWNVIAWEKTALDLAERAGVDVPSRQLRRIGESPVLLTSRFDRTPQGLRIGYMSAMTLCRANDGERCDYLDIAESLATISATTQVDLEQLWRRIAFGIAINNTDDHLRNHGLLRRRHGWQLSPAFDLNPDPNPDAAHATALAGVTRSSDSALTLIDTMPLFGLTSQRAAQVIQQVHDATKDWIAAASSNGIDATESARFTAAIETGRSALSSAVKQLSV